MAKKADAQTWMERTLGKTVADAVIRKAERLAKKGVSVYDIEEVIVADVMRHLRRRVITAIDTELRPISPRPRPPSK